MEWASLGGTREACYLFARSCMKARDWKKLEALPESVVEKIVVELCRRWLEGAHAPVVKKLQVRGTQVMLVLKCWSDCPECRGEQVMRN